MRATLPLASAALAAAAFTAVVRVQAPHAAITGVSRAAPRNPGYQRAALALYRELVPR
jgi:hypothetical protein